MGTRLGHWRPSEDEKLKEIVAQYGPHNWKAIAEKLEGRSGKSCRLRWFNQLDPRLNRSPFTEEEEQLLLALQRVHGNRWAVIAKLLGHTDNAVKNSWHVIMARPCRERMRQSSTAAGAWKDESTRNAGSGKLRLSETSAMAAKYPREYAGAGPSAISHHSSKEGCFSSTIDGTNRSVEFHDFLHVNVSSGIEENCGNNDRQAAEWQVTLIDFMGFGTSNQ